MELSLRIPKRCIATDSFFQHRQHVLLHQLYSPAAGNDHNMSQSGTPMVPPCELFALGRPHNRFWIFSELANARATETDSWDTRGGILSWLPVSFVMLVLKM